MTANQVANMKDREFEEYLSHISGSIDTTRRVISPAINSQWLIAHTGIDEIAAFFPGGFGPPPSPSIVDSTELQTREGAQRTLTRAIQPRPPSSSNEEPRDTDAGQYDAFRRVENLSDIARVLHTAAGSE